MFRSVFITSLIILLVSCRPNNEKHTNAREIKIEIKIEINKKALMALGAKQRQVFSNPLENFNIQIAEDSTNIKAYLGISEINILLFVFGLESRDNTIPKARVAFEKAYALDPFGSDVLKLSGKLSFLDKDWGNAETAFLKSIIIKPNDLDTRHWYSMFLMATKRTEEAFVQSNIIKLLDINDNFLIARASLFYFEHRFEEMKPLMDKAIKFNEVAPWYYEWLGMAYHGLKEHDDAIENYFKAFELSDGAVEVGGGLGHALALAGETKLAKEIADYYKMAADEGHYLPPVKRAFIHLGLGEYDEAIALLECAYEEKSWFLSFMQIEHWFDPIRKDERFIDLMKKMNFPQ